MALTAMRRSRPILAAVAVIAASATAVSVPVAAHADRRAVPLLGCLGTALSGTFTEVPGSHAMGHVEYTLQLTNGSSESCTVQGRPRLQLLDRSGKPLPTDVTPRQPGQVASVVALRPRETVRATALVAVDIPGPGDSQHPGIPCQPAAVHLRVGAPGEASSLVPIRPPTSVCRRGAISLGPFVTQVPAQAIPSGLRTMLERLLHYPPAEYTLTVRYDPNDRSWVKWLYAPAGPGDELQGGIGFAHLTVGTWHNVWGPGNPAFCQLGGAPTTVPATVLHAFGIACSSP